MAATTEQIAAMEAALFSGELRTRIGDREITWRSVDELKTALAEAKTSLLVSSGRRSRLVRVYSGSDI